MDISFALPSSQFGLLIAFLAGGTVLLGSVGLYAFLNSRIALQAVRRKVEGHWEGEGVAETPGSTASVTEGLFQSLTVLGHWAKPRRAEEISRTRKRLVQAGYRSADALMIFLGLKILLMTILPGLYVFLCSSSLSTLRFRTLCFSLFSRRLLAFIPQISGCGCSPAAEPARYSKAFRMRWI